MKEKFNLIATAAAGLEAVVGREIRDLGIDCQVENGRVRFSGDMATIIQTNLWLRSADRIKIVVGTFPAKTFEELFQGVFALDWENYLPLGAKFPISKAKCVKSKLHNEPSVQAISKKAVVKNQEEMKIKNLIERYCKNFNKALANGVGLYFYGVRGTGKTFYSLCIFNELSKNYKVYRTSLMGIYKRIKKTWKNKDMDEDQVLGDLLKADLIILDDLGKEYLSEEWGKEKLFEIFNMLYEQEKCLIISTTMDPSQMSEYLSINGSDDVLDRFRENCKGLSFNWESRRKEVKN